MKIEIKNRFTNSIIISGDYINIKDCLEKNRSSYLRGANLEGANLEGSDLEGSDLGGANLKGSDLGGANLEDANLEGAYLRDANLEGANLRGSDLGGAYLRGANLKGSNLEDANLRGANLEDANLRGIKNYADSHDIFQEATRRQPVSVFVEAEWSAIAQIIIHRLCWDSIKKRFSDVMPHIFETLSQAGFTEWQEGWNK